MVNFRQQREKYQFAYCQNYQLWFKIKVYELLADNICDIEEMGEGGKIV